MKTMTHDGYTFYYSEVSIRSTNVIIGFYFDRWDFVQPILRDSVYGTIVIEASKL